MIKINLWAFSLLLLISCKSEKEPGIHIEGELKQWHKVTLILEGIETSEWAKENPFLNYRLEVTFSNGSTSYVVPGYFAADGVAAETSAEAGSIWKVHFRPDQIGEWEYDISFRHGKDIAINKNSADGVPTTFDGLTGSFLIEASDKTDDDFRAKGRILNGGKGYFKFQESEELFIKNGTDSPENFLAYADFDQTYRYSDYKQREGEANPDTAIHQYLPHLSDWTTDDPTWKNGKGKSIIGAVNYLSEQGINSAYMLTMNILGDGKDVWPYNNHNERYRFDCSKLDQWEIVFDHMEKKGMMIHLVMQETENECLLDNGYTHVQRKLYLRELAARFGHHLGLIWNIGEENGPASWTPIGQTDQQRKDMASYMKEVNPYFPIVFLHTHSDDENQDKILPQLVDFENLDGPSMQVANPTKINERMVKWIDASKEKGKQWMVNLDELGPHWLGIMPDAFDEKHDTVRHHALWGALLAGGGGVEWYFGYKYPHNDLNLEDFSSREKWWQQSTIATKFIKQFPLESMESGNHLVNIPDAYCLAQPDNYYVIYWPANTNDLRINLKANKDFTVHWFNPRLGGDKLESNIKSIKGGEKVDPGHPPSDLNEDWVLVVQAKQ